MYLSPFLSCHLFFSSSLWYITVSLASSTPAYVQLGLKGKAELFCLWYVPAGVLSEALPSDRSTQAARWFMVYQNSRVIIVFCVRGKGATWSERYSHCSVIVWLQCCWLPHADSQEREEVEEDEDTHIHTWGFIVQVLAYTQGNLSKTHKQAGKRLLAQRYYLCTSIKHQPLHVSVAVRYYLIVPWHYHILMIVHPFSAIFFIPIFYIKQLSPVHYLYQLLPHCLPGRIGVT